MRRLVLYITLSFLFLSSCHSSKKVVNQGNVKQYETIALYDSIKAHYGDYSTVSFKFSLDSKELLKSLPIQVKGTVRIKKDSIIWISIAPTMNIEMFRCVLTKDSVKINSKFQKAYYEGSVDSLAKSGFPIDYNTIQALFLDEMFFLEQNAITDTLALFKTFDVNVKNNNSVVQTYSKKEYKKNDTLVLQQVWTIDNNNFKIYDIDIMDFDNNNARKVKIQYKDFAQYQNVFFPTKIDIKAKNQNAKFMLEMEYSKINFNEELSFPFTANSKYQKMEFKN